jgi:hypothetical protein
MTDHPNRKTLCTVLNRDGVVQARGCTAEEAAKIVLRYNGYDFVIGPLKEGYTLWVAHVSGNIPGPTRIRSYPVPTIHVNTSQRSAAETQIWAQVVRTSHMWGDLRVYSDAEYTASVAGANDQSPKS